MIYFPAEPSSNWEARVRGESQGGCAKPARPRSRACPCEANKQRGVNDWPGLTGTSVTPSGRTWGRLAVLGEGYEAQPRSQDTTN